MPRALAALACSLLAACSSSPPPSERAPAFPEPGTVHLDTLWGEAVLPFQGRAGQAVDLRVVGGAGTSLCLASAEAWARIQSAGAVAAPPPTDLAGDGLACSRATPSGEVALREVLPRRGAYVLVAEGEGPVRLRAWGGGGHVAPLAPGVPAHGDLARPGPWAPGPSPATGVHFVRGREGERLTVTVDSAAFTPYVEVGAWASAAYAPLVGNAAEADGGAARVDVHLPATGLYTVRVSAAAGAGGGYAVRAVTTPAEGLAARFPGGGDPAERYALVAAVADYPGLGGPLFQDDLSGPRADAERVRRLLVDDLGFRPEHVVVLRDADVTREALAEGFRRHLGQAGPGGTAFFHFAGHGVQLPAEVLQGRAEEDGYDEALAVWGRGDEITFLLDHELGALAEALPAEHVVLALDNCHSGDGTRGDGPEGAALRRLAYRDVADQIVAPADLLGEGGHAGAERHVLLSAARAEQPSLELDGLAPDGGRAGVFTTALVEALREAGPTDTFGDVIDRIRPFVEHRTASVMEEVGYAPQSPQAEGAQATAPVHAALGPPPDR